MTSRPFAGEITVVNEFSEKRPRGSNFDLPTGDLPPKGWYPTRKQVGISLAIVGVLACVLLTKELPAELFTGFGGSDGDNERRTPRDGHTTRPRESRLRR